MRAAAPRARSLPRSVYGAGAETRVTLIRTRSISPRRRNPAYQVFISTPTCTALSLFFPPAIPEQDQFIDDVWYDKVKSVCLRQF